MKHFGKKLLTNSKNFAKKVESLDPNDPLIDPSAFQNGGINLKSLFRIPGKIYAYLIEGDDGESYIHICYGPLGTSIKQLELIAVLSSYNNTIIYFKRFWFSQTERSTAIYNYLLPEDYLVEYVDHNYSIGKSLIPCRFNETSKILFNSKNEFVYGLNITPEFDSNEITKEYNDVVTNIVDEFNGQIKLLGRIKLEQLLRKAIGLHSDIKPQYAEILNRIVKQKHSITDLINLMTIVGHKHFKVEKAASILTKVLKNEALYGKSFLNS